MTTNNAARAARDVAAKHAIAYLKGAHGINGAPLATQAELDAHVDAMQDAMKRAEEAERA